MRIIYIDTPNRSNPVLCKIIECDEETFSLKQKLDYARKIYKEKEIFEYTGMDFIKFLDFNEEDFGVQLKEIETEVY